MKKIKKKTLLLVVAALVVLIVSFNVFGDSNKVAPTVKYTTLNKGDLIDSINVSGKIKSENEYNIYSKESLIIKEILVSEGDEVKAGDILAYLDSDTLHKDIEKTKLSIQSSQKSKTDEQTSISNSIKNAENSVENAKITLDKATLNFERVKKDYDNGTNAELTNAQMSLDMSKLDLENAQDNLDKMEVLFSAGAITEQQHTSSKTQYENALTKYNNSLDAYNQAKLNFENTFRQAELDLAAAKVAYENALVSLNFAKSKDTTQSQLSLNSQNIDLEKLTDKVDNSIITSPADGTVTLVNIKVGQVPTGIIFEVEDMQNLFVSAYVKEFDIGNVKIGQNVVIKTDATKDKEIEGVVSYIAPTSRKDSTSSSVVEFEIHVKIINPDPDLRIGMDARMNIICEKTENTFYAIYDSVIEKPNGEKSVYVIENNKVKEISVSTGLESDVYVELISDKLTEGMQIVPNPGDFSPGQKVN